MPEHMSSRLTDHMAAIFYDDYGCDFSLATVRVYILTFIFVDRT
jgi:hypothetical protein